MTEEGNERTHHRPAEMHMRMGTSSQTLSRVRTWMAGTSGEEKLRRLAVMEDGREVQHAFAGLPQLS
jgi:hypothetical protein